MFETAVYFIKRNKAREIIVKLLCPGKRTRRTALHDLLTIQYIEDTKDQSINVANSRGNAGFGFMDDPGHKVGIFIAIGTHFYFWEGHSGFLDRILVTLKVYWSITGDFSGVCGTVGITYRIR